jgi:hypothetical protein
MERCQNGRSRCAIGRLSRLWKGREFRNGESGQSLSKLCGCNPFAWWLIERICGQYQMKWEVISAGNRVEESPYRDRICLDRGDLDCCLSMDGRFDWLIWQRARLFCQRKDAFLDLNGMFGSSTYTTVDISWVWCEHGICSRILGYDCFFHSRCSEMGFYIFVVLEMFRIGSPMRSDSRSVGSTVTIEMIST